MNRTILLLPLFSCACTAALHDDTFATGSQTVIGNADHDALYVVDTDGGAVVRYDPATGASSSVEVGGIPTRLARAGDDIYVTLRGTRSIGVLADHDGQLSRVDSFEVGAEPVGIVAREDGKRLYVALSAQDEVAEVDPAARTVLRTWHVDGHPEFLALHPSGNALYVGSAMGGHVSWVDLSEGGQATEMDLPAIYGAGADGTERFSRRVTGDLAVSANGESLSVPAIYIDNDNPVSDPGEVETTSDGYGSVGLGVSRFNPAVVVVPVGDGGNPSPGDSATVLVAGFAQLGSQDDGSTAVRSYLSSTTYSPDSQLIYATMEASSSVVVLSATPVYPNQSPSSCGGCEMDFDTGGSGISAESAGFSSSPLVLIGTDAGPRGVAFLGDDQAYVHAFLDRTIGSLYGDEARSKMNDQYGLSFVSQETFRGGSGAEVAPAVLSDELDAGRRLFYSATASQMAASGAGVSCSTCHFEGRNDGLTWTFENGVRQTPSLAGAVSVTAPFTWTSEVGTVSDEAQITSSGRMGGNGLSYAEAAGVAAFIESTPAVDLPTKGSTDASVLRGKALFEREDVGCAGCHNGARFTDNLSYPMFGLEAVNTPTLTGVAATAPYLHDGSASSLAAVLQVAKSGEMGNTSMLSDDELADLEAYLNSL
jgi:DNA-binding beta-propeller fold protein YncE